MIDFFTISKLIIKKYLKVLNEADKNQFNKFSVQYPFLKDIKIESLMDKVEQYSSINKDKAWEAIEDKVLKKDPAVIPLQRTPWIKYAVAATIIGILFSVYLIKINYFGSTEKVVPVIVNIDTIEPGTNKATLTLDDGSHIVLEKGESYNTNEASSNGEQIIYKSGQRTSSEIAYNYLTIPRGGQFNIKLSDGTKVWLNSETQLKYPISFIKGEIRQVELVYGEAYFDVSPSTEHEGSKFVVRNQKQDIEVLGTEFNIKAYKDETTIYTTLVEGRVSVSSAQTNKVLKPNQQSKLNLLDNSISVNEVDVYNEISWKEGVFSFNGKTLQEVMKVLSRWYDVDVTFENGIDKKEEEFVGLFSKDKGIENILKTMKNSGTINNYEVYGKKVILN
ncbi:FecR family protein [Flavivirga sp. 57AJ16]|uniref:FecR family protein n=1 Tax=Flavivirga sp. 57AJ16 TaxID=3025307 RepID=UPI002365C28D|nr:FecR family protein [Flavivirga sp. 57AJ16]MDD7886263.1 FecR domain-containing protein [Flavivirga sp. 57AJ16]